MNEMITEEGEILTTVPAIAHGADQSLAVALSRAEIDHQITTARAYPRSIERAIRNVTTLATLDEATAESCIYALPRGNKPIQGPSIRLAEIVAGQWGNNRNGARVVHVDRAEKVVIAEGTFHDLETNVQTSQRVQRRIVDSRGRLYNDDMIIVTGNAACSIAKRNVILAGVPRGIWGGAYERALGVVAGTAETLSVTRDKAVKAFANFGVKPEQVFAVLGLQGYEDITLNHIPSLRGMFAALRNGEATVEEMFAPQRSAASTHAKVENPLAGKDEGPRKTRGADASQARADHVEGPGGEVVKSRVADPTEQPPADAPASDTSAAPLADVGAEAEGVSSETGDASAPEPDPLDRAYERGWIARRNGMLKRALPGDYRAEGREAERDAWERGWDEGAA